MKYTTVAVIYNPNSTGPSETLAKIFETNLRLKLPKQKIELIATEHAGHGEELAYLIAKSSKNPLIISSSGDGGYHEVINGVMKAQNEGFQSITGLLPAGNANDHYNNLHNEDIIDLIIKNKTKKIDLLKIVSTSKGKSIERYAHSYIGFGLTPSVGKELNKT
ncbi:acylglycerol kinase family protein, partial [Candidatus Saccharibacteria bacterium]|nr:acylglycerol kinase family protein [Candidatus Saccharibacteria bacterium]